MAIFCNQENGLESTSYLIVEGGACVCFVAVVVWLGFFKDFFLFCFQIDTWNVQRPVSTVKSKRGKTKKA